ncbi:MAG: hypothetical protein ACREQ5_30860 [Candidatus Dormibacteria bacterium]
MPTRKPLSIEEKNVLERSAIDLAKSRGYGGIMLTGYVDGWMANELEHRKPRKRAAAKPTMVGPLSPQTSLLETPAKKLRIRTPAVTE